jgi:DNA polymerase epsilon subunit 1
VVVTYNGDNFDFPYIAKRCEVLGLDLKKETGFGATSDAQSTHFLSTCCTHIDAIHWVT